MEKKQEVDLGKLPGSSIFEGGVIRNVMLDSLLLKQQRVRLLVVTPSQIAEVTPLDKLGFGLVDDVFALEDLVKLRFKRGEDGVLSMTFKDERVVNFLMANASQAVEKIKLHMQKLGVEGTHTQNSGSLKQVASAEAFLTAAQQMMDEFDRNPSHKMISNLMELFKEAAERFGQASDDRYLSVIALIQGFLQREDVVAVLELRYEQQQHHRKNEPQTAPQSSSSSSNSSSSSSSSGGSSSSSSSSSSGSSGSSSSGSSEVSKSSNSNNHQEGSSMVSSDAAKDMERGSEDEEEEEETHGGTLMNLVALGEHTNNSKTKSGLAIAVERMREYQHKGDSIDDGDDEVDSSAIVLTTSSMDALERELSIDLASMTNEFSTLLESFGQVGAGDGSDGGDLVSEEFSLRDFEDLMSSLKDES